MCSIMSILILLFQLTHHFHLQKYVLNPPFSNMPPFFLFFFLNSLPKRCFHQQPLGLLWVEPQNFLSHDWYWLGPSSLSFRWHYHNLAISTDSIRILYHEVSLYTVCTHFDWVKTCMKRASIAQGSPVPKLMPFSTIWSCGAATKGILTWVF